MAQAKIRQLKVVLLGDGTTGKTSIATRLSENAFNKGYQQTLGVDFFLKRLELPGGVQVAMEIWDIGGQSIGGQMLDNYIFGADAVLFIYDLTNYSSFENLADWLRVVKRVCSQSLPRLALVANKIDLEHMRTVRRDKHQAFASLNGMSSHFVSAKTDDLLTQCLMKVAANVLQINLSSSDLDTSTKVIKADIVQCKTDSPTENDTMENKRTTSAICCLQ